MADEFTKVEDIKNNPFLNTETSLDVGEPDDGFTKVEDILKDNQFLNTETSLDVGKPDDGFTKVEDILANNSILKNSRSTDSFRSHQPTQSEEKVDVEKNLFGSSYIRRDEKGNVSLRR